MRKKIIFYVRLNEGIFFGYSIKRKACQCYNKRLKKIIESINVKVSEEWNHVALELEVDIEGTLIATKEK